MTIRRHLCQAEQRVLRLQSMGLWLLAPLPRRELVLHLEALMVGKRLRLDHVHARSAAAVDSCSRPTTSGFAAAAAVSEDSKSPKEIANPWNQFQHDFKGKGFSKATLAKMYKYQKMKDQKKMP